MKTKKFTNNCFYSIVLSSTLLLINLNCLAQQQIENYEKRGLEKEIFFDEEGNPRPDLFRQSIIDFSKIKKGHTSHLGNTTTWDQVGPAPANVNSTIRLNGQLPGPNAGSIVDIVIDPRGVKDSIIYVASNSGGIWKSTNGGKNWAPKTDHLPTLSIGAIALDPNNPDMVYAGTGNIFNNGYIMAIGIYISKDGGDSWQLTTDNKTLLGKPINKMIIPSPGVILVASRYGFFRSTDNGNSFTEISIGGAKGMYITDLDMQEGNPNNIWVGVSGHGIYASTNKGESFGNNLWKKGSGFVPPTPYAYGFVSLALSSNAQTIMANAKIAKPWGSPPPNAILFKSIDGGSTWINLSDKIANKLLPQEKRIAWRDINACQCGYDQTMGIDPTNSNRVYMGFQDMWISEDGGNSWNDATLSFAPKETTYVEQMHVDHHALFFSPTSHRQSGSAVRLWVGNDGGVWSSSDNGRSWNNHNKGNKADSSLATHLFRHIDIGRGTGNNQWTYGGTQDNGTSVGNPNNKQAGWNVGWNEWSGGDGSYIAVDWNNPQKAFGNWGSTNNGGASIYGWYGFTNIEAGYAASVSIAESGPKNKRIYFGGSCDSTVNRVTYKWIPTLFISENTSNYFRQSWQPTNKTTHRISSIAATPANSNILYVTVSSIYSMGGGVAHKLTESNGVITDVELSIPGIYGQSPVMAVNPSDANMAVAVYAGYSRTRWPTPSKHVFLTTDGGTNWKDIGGSIEGASIPDMPLYDAVIDPNTTPQSILVASDFGVFRSFDFGLTWHTTGKNLPNVHSVSLALDPTVIPSLVKVGTFGRSIWEDTLAVGNRVYGAFSANRMRVNNVKWQNNSNEALSLNFITSGADGEIPFQRVDYSLAGNTKNFFTSPNSGQPTFVANFSGVEKDDILFFNPGDQNWWLGKCSTDGKLNFTLAGNTANFFTSPKSGQPTFVADFSGTNKDDILFFNPGDQNWWLGQFSDSGKLSFALAGNTANFFTVPGGGQPTFVADFTGSGKQEILFYNPGDQNWWLGRFNSSGKFSFTLAGNTANFFTAPNGGQPTFVADFTGSGKQEILFYNPGDQNWWLGRFNSSGKFSFALAGNTNNSFTFPSDVKSTFTADFTGSGKQSLLFLDQTNQNWWLGQITKHGQLNFTLAGNTTNFYTSPNNVQPTYVQDFTGSGKQDLLFFNPGDQNWWLGQMLANNNLYFTLAGNTTNFLSSPGTGQPTFVADFMGKGKGNVLFYNPGDQNWWLGQPDNKLLPNQSVYYNPAYFTDIIVARDQPNNLVLVYPITGNGNQAVTISQTAVDLAKTNKLQGFPGLRSLPGGGSVANFKSINYSNVLLNFNRVDQNGKSTMVDIVRTGGARTLRVQNVSFGETFTVTDPEGRLIGVYVASDDDSQSFIITQEMVDFWKYSGQ